MIVDVFIGKSTRYQECHGLIPSVFAWSWFEEWTRVSLDVRLICGPTFHALKFADGKLGFNRRLLSIGLSIGRTLGQVKNIEEATS